MGMFNHVTCEMPLPDMPDDPRIQKYGFQTKCLGENLMDNYRITAEGYLEKEEFHFERTGRWFVWNHEDLFGADAHIFVDPPESPPVDSGGLDFNGPFPEENRVDDGWHLVDFSGAFNFYANGANDQWYEFVAYVERGKVFKIIRDHDREFRMRNYP